VTSVWGRTWGRAAVATLLIWAGLEWGLRRSSSITDDWHGWRQADTQAIARNFAFEDFDLLAPRIDWRGAGPGYVEAELQLYPAIIALVMRITGENEWPGQLVSLLCVAVAAAALFAALARRFGDAPAYVALVAMLATKGTVVIATSIQPDTLSLLGFTVGFVAFRAYLDDPTAKRLVLWVVATALAGLVKPTTLELGIAQAVMCALLRPNLLRSPRLWLGWGVVLALVAAHLLHARQLYLDYGNTFGVLSGGDNKLPYPGALVSPRLWFGVASFEVVWGIGVLGALAVIYRIVSRTLGAEEVALAAAALVSLALAFRYASGPFGTHYHLPHVVLGGWLVARAVADQAARRIARRWIRQAAFGCVMIAAVLMYARAVRAMTQLPPAPETAVGALLGSVSPPGTLVAVRARAPSYDPEWKTINNFEDPRVFYVSRTKGWVLANDQPGAAPLAEVAAQGARYYAHVNQVDPDSELRAWLHDNAELISTSEAGAVYSLRQPPAQ
jgi:4-amino-4-deoxy-L-arabinose transferase-like glycosyltransferase